MNIKKLSYSALFIAIGVVSSTFYIPMGFAKCFPVQHMINILLAVMLGPFYAVSCAFLTSLIRNIMGTGSLFAFFGSMIGSFLAGIFYKKTRSIFLAFLGEVVGTGIIGAILCYPIAIFVMNKQVALFAYVVPFSLSSFTGAIFAVVLLKALSKAINLEKIFNI